MGPKYLRHQDHTKVKPVPRVAQKSELPHAEASGKDLYEGLKSVNPCECVSGEKATMTKIVLKRDCGS